MRVPNFTEQDDPNKDCSYIPCNCLSKIHNTFNLVLLHTYKWFHANQLISNVEKIQQDLLLES